MLDRLPMTYAARPMRGHRGYMDLPAFVRRAASSPSEARPTHSSAVEASAERGNGK